MAFLHHLQAILPDGASYRDQLYSRRENAYPLTSSATRLISNDKKLTSKLPGSETANHTRERLGLADMATALHDQQRQPDVTTFEQWLGLMIEREATD